MVFSIKDDKRMERMKRRLDELELVQNNIKLMNELMSHYKPNSGDQEKQLLLVDPPLHSTFTVCIHMSSMCFSGELVYISNV